MNWTNPTENTLGHGLTLDHLENAVRSSGYPLQTVAAIELGRSFDVVEEWGYIDRSSGEPRTLDLFAHKVLSGGTQENVWPSVALLIECKRSALPYVFFRAVTLQDLHGFPDIAGLGGVISIREPQRSRDVSIARALGLHVDPFYDAPPISRVFSKAERKGGGQQVELAQPRLDLSGSEPFNGIVLPLISALEYWLQYRATGAAPSARISPTLTVCACILDAPMVVVEGTPEEPKLSMEPWVRVVRQEAAVLNAGRSARRQYVIDVVHRRFITEYMNRLLAFAEFFGATAARKADTLLRRQGWVDNIDSWRPEDVRPDKKSG